MRHSGLSATRTTMTSRLQSMCVYVHALKWGFQSIDPCVPESMLIDPGLAAAALADAFQVEPSQNLQRARSAAVQCGSQSRVQCAPGATRSHKQKSYGDKYVLAASVQKRSHTAGTVVPRRVEE
jgi:hypothetical protein